MITIGIPKGYLLKESLTYFAARGIVVESFSDRQLIFNDKSGEYRFMILRPVDVAVYVEHGVVDIGVTGMDIIREEKPELVVAKDLGFGYCRLAVAAAENYEKHYTNGITVATKFVHCAREYFNQLGIKTDIIKLYGSVELAAITGLSDIIVDLVASGQTLKENHLKEVETIFESTAHLVINSVFYSLHFDTVKKLI